MSSTLFSAEALRGRVAVVTGAAQGIGRRAAAALARAGADVVGLDLCAQANPSTPSPRPPGPTSTKPAGR